MCFFKNLKKYYEKREAIRKMTEEERILDHLDDTYQQLRKEIYKYNEVL